ncbi:hypothetical protein O3M35_001694 [Rhynocoris fuscipes]|uniref:6-phosphogluconolactonase n=1 Tax=Rhynocoris fuscipes TaxID=488301 RepID=A0AAW1CPT6_9HEMI
MSEPIINIYNSENDVILHLCKLIEEIAQLSIKNSQTFKIGLSGGSLITFLSKGLKNIDTDWSKWILFFCDERIVPSDNPDSTFGTYKANLLDKVPLKESQFVCIDENLNAEEAAKDYTSKIKKYFPDSSLPRFDLLLLGMGPDGHTASLFPDHPLLKEINCWVAPITDSPKPPPSRVTLTFPVINNAANCIFAVCGEGKAKVVKQILKEKINLPATLVRPVEGALYWLLDKGAASQL